MTVQARLEKLINARDVIGGVRRRLGKRAALWVAGKKLTPNAVIAVYEEQLAAMEAVRQAHIAYELALAAERKLRRPVQTFTLDLKATVRNELGLAAYRDFGWKLPRKPGPKTLASKLAGVQKRAAKKRRG